MMRAMQDGRKLSVLNINDDFNREALAIEIDLSLPSNLVIRTLQYLEEEQGLPQMIRVDNGLEFSSHNFRW
ncbi:transposase family protein [Fulvivirga sp. M361]|uniref:transposase family protein n=1 Tax=Fulvivirga sp. M361 TaxID=2594266 RepID=UPI001179DADD|nr:transposase family protein [Fulvivirga sp. M361]